MPEFTNVHRLDMLKIGDMPTVVELQNADGTPLAIVFGANMAHLIMSLLNDYFADATSPEHTGEDK